MHCLLIHQAFAGLDDPGGTRHYELAQALSKAGHEFTVVTSELSYLTGKSKGRVIVGEEIEGQQVRVFQTWTLNTLHRSFVWRVVAFLSFVASSIVKSLGVPDVDLVIGTSPPIFQAFAAWFVAAVKRVPFVLEVRDLWPEFAIDMGVLTNPMLIWFSRHAESFLYRRASHIVVNSPAYKTYLEDRGVPSGRVSVVPNGVDPTMFEPRGDGRRFRDELGVGSDSFVVIYAGALGMANDIPTILGAAKTLDSRGDIKFVLVGDGKERKNLERMAAEMRLGNVVFPGSVVKARMPEVLAASDACIATLMNIQMFKTTYPNKVFDYMAAARPTVLGIDGAIREVVEDAGGGIFVTPGNPDELSAAVLRLADDRVAAREMGRRARAYVEERFDRRRQLLFFASTLEKVVEAAGQHRV